LLTFHPGGCGRPVFLFWNQFFFWAIRSSDKKTQSETPLPPAGGLKAEKHFAIR
jgi:hypothetical protein